MVEYLRVFCHGGFLCSWLIAALLGFGGIAGSFVGVAKILFVVFLIIAVLSFLGVGFRRGSYWV